VLIVCNVLGLGWLGKLKEDVVIYDCADEISHFKQARLMPKAVQAQERELMKRADAVVTTSKLLYDSKIHYARKIELIRNGAEVKHFNRALHPCEKPKDVAHLTKPIVGFYGYLADWLNWELIKEVVSKGKEFDWVFIGPSIVDMTDFRKLSNFHYLGKKPYSELPNYLAHFACAHIPFAYTPLTMHVNPVKLYEYLAGGAPVVATPLPEYEAFKDVCEVAKTADEYLEAIRRAVSSDSPEKRAERAKRVAHESWEKRIEAYMKLIEELLK